MAGFGFLVLQMGSFGDFSGILTLGLRGLVWRGRCVVILGLLKLYGLW